MARLTVSRSIEFSASHRLPNVPPAHKCSRHHGHTYRVTAEVSGPVDSTLGWVVDFGIIDIALRQMVHGPLDHRHLNEIEGLENPTSEVLAAWCAKRLVMTLEGIEGLRLTAVVVHEGNGGWARWEP